MIWSISTDKLFRRCQREWFFKQVFANARARKQPERYEAYLLAKLSSVSSIRGQAVDDALTERLIPSLNRGRIPACRSIQQFAQHRFTNVLELAREASLDDRVSEPKKLPAHFRFLFDDLYGDGSDEDEIDRAYQEIDDSIENLYETDEVLDTLRASDYAISQRALTWRVGEHSVRAVPDVIAFFTVEPPLVLDWKVHVFGNADAARQLASYSLALARVKPHRDFPFSTEGWPETETRLWECQLLKAELRKFEYSADEYNDLDQWIASRVTETSLSLHGRKKSNDFAPEDFPTAFDGRPCERCNFKRLCWNRESA